MPTRSQVEAALFVAFQLGPVVDAKELPRRHTAKIDKSRSCKSFISNSLGIGKSGYEQCSFLSVFLFVLNLTNPRSRAATFWRIHPRPGDTRGKRTSTAISVGMDRIGRI
jgi:hypothetical protein